MSRYSSRASERIHRGRTDNASIPNDSGDHTEIQSNFLSTVYSTFYDTVCSKRYEVQIEVISDVTQKSQTNSKIILSFQKKY